MSLLFGTHNSQHTSKPRPTIEFLFKTEKFIFLATRVSSAVLFFWILLKWLQTYWQNYYPLFLLYLSMQFLIFWICFAALGCYLKKILTKKLSIQLNMYISCLLRHVRIKLKITVAINDWIYQQGVPPIQKNPNY